MKRIYPNVIIFGGMRCGTTSLFRYISAHPNVFVSNKKELDIFYYNTSANYDVIEGEYKKEFSSYKGKQSILLEASPRYARKYVDISRKIFAIIPDVKIIYLIREPTERILSVYKAIWRSGILKDNVSFNDFIMAMFNQESNVLVDEEASKDILEELYLGLYLPIIKTLVNDFGKDRVFVECLETVSANPYMVMDRVCKYIEIDESYYNKYKFSIENPTVSVKSPKIYKLALEINHMLEPFLNRMSKIRSVLRMIHHTVNSKPKKDDVELNANNNLNNYYKQSNKELAKFLTNELNMKNLPLWLRYK